MQLRCQKAKRQWITGFAVGCSDPCKACHRLNVKFVGYPNIRITVVSTSQWQRLFCNSLHEGWQSGDPEEGNATMTHRYNILDEQIFCRLIVAGKIENRLVDREVEEASSC